MINESRPTEESESPRTTAMPGSEAAAATPPKELREEATVLEAVRDAMGSKLDGKDEQRIRRRLNGLVPATDRSTGTNAVVIATEIFSRGIIDRLWR